MEPPTGVDPPVTSSTETPLQTTTLSIIIPTSAPTLQTTTVSFVPNLNAASLARSDASTSSFLPAINPNNAVGSSSSSTPLGISSLPSPSAVSANSETGHISHKTLVIILSTVIGSVGIILVITALWLIHRYRRGKSPFSHRGASPIDDEEIASWRAPPEEPKLPILQPGRQQAGQDVDTIGLAHSPDWMWPSAPPAVRPRPSISTIIPNTPCTARAPNSRAGLTDEAIPGADPFIPPMKRQSSRLSKTPPGHARTKSRRSSMSGKSIWSYNGTTIGNVESKPRERTHIWYDPENDNIGRELKDLDHASSSPGTSIFDGLAVAGGLSPRPASRPRLSAEDKEIGRAIA
ncbi:uncharacterized protein BP5553_01908 [Venustampulla echinocandica]|uniref:Uncharacterized protein n=1 Tax=Venustampulla echinocandica TaxID=2656787 RepID=A0A370U2B7_9HELO|nr:uncharacterized protein BP5553_01908 [Venustampulla echinocandica]RDL41929.1 hypothetical protein BP5553_01908 [Venustampulla echinocandica]